MPDTANELWDVTQGHAHVDAQALAQAVERAVSGEAPAPVPSVIEPRSLIDPDAVARWLVAHEGSYTLTVGWWRWKEARDWNDKVTGTCGGNTSMRLPRDHSPGPKVGDHWRYT